MGVFIWCSVSVGPKGLVHVGPHVSVRWSCDFAALVRLPWLRMFWDFGGVKGPTLTLHVCSPLPPKSNKKATPVSGMETICYGFLSFSQKNFFFLFWGGVGGGVGGVGVDERIPHPDSRVPLLNTGCPLPSPPLPPNCVGFGVCFQKSFQFPIPLSPPQKKTNFPFPHSPSFLEKGRRAQTKNNNNNKKGWCVLFLAF
jgi:hypothetical protein